LVVEYLFISTNLFGKYLSDFYLKQKFFIFGKNRLVLLGDFYIEMKDKKDWIYDIILGHIIDSDVDTLQTTVQKTIVGNGMN